MLCECTNRLPTVTGNDLCEHQLLGLVRLSVGATRQPALAARRARRTLGVETAAATPRAQPITVDAHDEAALVAHPVHVEERRVAHVAHLTHTLHGALPRQLGCNGRTQQATASSQTWRHHYTLNI